MITHLTGTLTAIDDGAAHVRSGDLTYEVLVPAADAMALAARIGQPASFHTLHYLEAQGQGSSFWPRLIGFQSTADRAFFELFTTVKGIGTRKALRALQLPFGQVAEAIASRDHALLQSLPEIGKRTAETICVELKGKVDPFVRGIGAPGPGPNGKATARGPVTAEAKLMAAARDAVEVLVQLGHAKPAARDLVERAIAREDLSADATPEAIVERALR
ncbi:MAG: putative Holliday junction ATP-dependent helicase RuvA [Planctomycetota bacterium]|jgi:Holliday junction DNA helicase RuvA